MTAPIKADTERARRRAALLSATMAAFLTPFLGSAVNVALPRIGTQLGMDAVHLSWVPSAFLLASAVCLLPFGRLADLVGRRRIFLLGMAVLMLSSLFCALSASGTQLVWFRVLQGAGASMIFSTALAILTSVFPASERGRVLGINAAAVYLGLSMGPWVGGLLTSLFGWRSVFLAVIPPGLLAGLVAWRGLGRDNAESTGARFDVAGAAMYAVGLIALMLGFAQLPDWDGAVVLALGLVVIALFWAWERRTESPVLDVRLFEANRVFALSNLAAFANYAASYAVIFLLSFYLQTLRGLDPAHAGLVLLTQPLLMMAVSPFAGRLSDRMEPRIVSSLGMALTVAGLLGLAALDAGSSLVGVIAALALFGTGLGLFSSPNTNAVMGSVDKRQLGVASATLGTMRLTGQMFSMGLATLSIALFVGHATLGQADGAAFLHAQRAALLAFAGMCALGIFASLARGRLHASA